MCPMPVDWSRDTGSEIEVRKFIKEQKAERAGRMGRRRENEDRTGPFKL